MIETNLHRILENVDVISITGNSNKTIALITTDSRKIGPNDLFVAISGVSINGHDYIQSAIEKGATCILCEILPAEIIPEITYILCKNSQKTCGELLRNYYSIDFTSFKVIGVTGTNGKTTTATLLYKLFSKLGFTCGLISTVKNYINEIEIESTHTTPDTIQLYNLFHTMIENKCEYCFMEVSSHAIHQNRISGIEFTAGIFSNITQDHLDYHKTFAEYLRVKKSFFDSLPSSAFALSNFDDKNGEVMLQNTKAKKVSYSLHSFTDFKCKIIETHFDGMLLQIDSTQVWTKFIGAFNAYNLLSVYATAVLLGANKQNVLEILSTLNAVDGRIEFYKNTNGTTAIIDYAHTPDALENVLSTIKKLCTPQNKIITVVGAGGDRDTTKRPLMGSICAKLSDKVILTSDNPRSEDPAVIAKQMEEGISDQNMPKVTTILDRKEAIKVAVMLAGNNDIILIAGKGHENYQEIKGVKHHFDDREIIKELFKL